MAYTFKHGDRPLEGVTIQRAVGRGGFGEVYYAVADSGKQIALKYLRENPDVELRGIAHVMNLKSPYLVTIYDVRKNEAGEPFVVMEYISGPSLRDMLIAESGGMSGHKVAFLFEGIAKGLSYLHERGIVHRDLKPGNIFYDDGYVKIGDYGLSKHISVSKHSGQTVSVGTVHYMAPEIGSGSYTKAIDIYALGVILYEMLTGRLPFTGSSMGEVLMRHLRDEPDLSGVPAPFARIIAKALEKDPNDRYQDAEEMLAAVMELDDFQQGASSFDASQLTQVPRVEDGDDPQRTMTSPPRPPQPPPLDVRDVAHGAPANLPPRMQEKLEQLSRKLEERAGRLEQRMGRPQAGRRQARGAGHAHAVRRRAETPQVRRWPQITILVAVTVMVSLLMVAIFRPSREPEELTVTLIMLMIGSVVGPLLAHLWLLQRSLTRNTVIDRLAYAALGGACMFPGFLVAQDFSNEFPAIIVAPLVVLLLFDWNRRIEDGRRGKVDGWDALWPAIVGGIAAAIADVDDYVFFAVGLCAAQSLLIQATAALWPVTRGRATLPGPGGPPEPDIVGAEARPGPNVPPPPPSADAGDTAQRAGMQAVPPAPPNQPEAAAPSFTSRHGRSGVGMLGKVLMTLGLAVALLAQPARVQTHAMVERGVWHANDEIVGLVSNGVPPVVVFVPLVIGSLLLLAGRRNDSGMHFARGFFGCILVCAGALIALTSASVPLAHALLGTGPPPGSMWDALVYVVAPLVAGLALLWWPKPRGERTIFI